MEKVECIVVGGGLAGLSAAYGLAGAGAEVMVLERGDYSGAKNVTGGRLYVSPIRRLYPELWEEAPYERPVHRELITMMGDGAHTTVELASENLAGEQPQSYTVVRAKLDQWLAEKVGEKGGMVVPGMKVDELLLDKGRVIGIKAGEDEIGADVVVVAEGALRLLTAPAGLAGKPEEKDYALGYKEVIELPAGTIEDRWNLNPGEGAAQLFLGSVTRGMLGGGFLYTNKESISLGVVVGMHAMKADGREIESHSLLEQFKEQPQVKPLVAGGTVAEYSAHAIPEGGIAQVPRLYGDGYVLAGDAAGLSLNALVTVRGMDFAIASGYFAAQAVLKARAAGDFSAAALASYEAGLRDSFVLKDLETARTYPQFMDLVPRLYGHYPTAVSRLMEDVFTVGPGPTPSLIKKAWKGVRRDFLKLGTLQDAWQARKL